MGKLEAPSAQPAPLTLCASFQPPGCSTQLVLAHTCVHALTHAMQRRGPALCSLKPLTLAGSLAAPPPPLFVSPSVG